MSVTTFGEEFPRGFRGSVAVADFPNSGERRTLVWQQSQQNFVITAGQPSQGGGASGGSPQVLENPPPGSFQSGVGVLSGWVCDAERVELIIGDLPPQRAGYGTERLDTAGACGDTDNGFGLLFNWNRLRDGLHTVRALADGREFAQVTVQVTTLGEEFARGLSQEVTLADFPEMGTDTTLVWQQAQQNFIVTTALPTQRQVSVSPAVTIPAGVTSVSASNVSVTALGSSTSEVRASPAPTLLLAEDDGGTVLLTLADLDGGLLGEGSGQVEASIDSTAVTLVALTAGVPLHAIDQSLVDEIQAHAQYPALCQAMTQALQADKNFLDQILTYPEVMRLIREVATFQTNTAQALAAPIAAAPPPPQPTSIAQAIAAALADLQQSASIQAAGLPDGERHDFVWWSPWDEHEPWRWFDSGILFAPPFLANSLHPDYRSLHATGNPNYVAYALELYTQEAYRDWLYISGNGSVVEKVGNSGAAQRLITARPGGAGYRFSPDIAQVRFARYRLSAGSWRAGILSFINTFNMALSVVHLLADVRALSTWLDTLGELDDAVQAALLPCFVDIATGLQPPDETAGDADEQASRFLTSTLGNTFRKAFNCLLSNPSALLRKLGLDGDLLKDMINETLHRTLPKVFAKTSNPAGWAALILDGANTTAPVLGSYFLPAAGDVDYALEWATTADGTPYIVRVTEQPVRVTGPPIEPPGPPARPTNLRVSASGATVTVRWDAVAGTGIRYVLYQHYGGGRYWAREVDGRSTTFDDRQANTEYCFTVVAVNPARQESAPSARQCVRTGTDDDGELPPPGTTFTDPLTAGGVGPEMVVLPAGSFRMGCLSDDNDCRDAELPVHQVTVPSFAIGKYEVTFAEWDACVAGGGCKGYQPPDQGWGRGDRPVINVSWEAAQSYVIWLSAQTGETYRLPSEAEWEYAARAGTETKYHWGNSIVGQNRANCKGCGSLWDGEETAPVGSFGPNAFGLYDVHGNVWEWVLDCWNSHYVGAPSNEQAWEAGQCDWHPIRGGSWESTPRALRSAFRGAQGAGSLGIRTGFRVARSLP